VGIAHIELRLANDGRSDLEEINKIALVDTGALHLCIPEHVALQLQLKDTGFRDVRLADGQEKRVRYVSPIRIELFGRQCVTGALVLGDEVLLGAIPMEDMDLVIEPAHRQVSVNPNSPNMPTSLAKASQPRSSSRATL
jgi:clan AA aspartic protease